MSHTAISSDVADLNTAYLVTAQKLLRVDRSAGMLQLGYTSDVADFVSGLDPAQIVNLAAANTVLCGLRIAERMPAVLRSGYDDWLQRVHLFIVLAGERAEPRREDANEEFPEWQ